MTKKRFLWWSIPVLVAILAATALACRDLPAIVPTHWNAAGEVDGHGPRGTLFLLPALGALTALLWTWLPAVSPHKFRVEDSGATWWFCGMVVVGLFAYIQAVMLMALTQGGLDLGRALMGGIGIAIVLLGNVLGKVKRNFWLGVRTPWTLASERVWYATHRLAGKSMVVGGLATLAVAAFGLPPSLGTAAILLGALVPAGYSLVYYKRLERTGGA